MAKPALRAIAGQGAPSPVGLLALTCRVHAAERALDAAELAYDEALDALFAVPLGHSERLLAASEREHQAQAALDRAELELKRARLRRETELLRAAGRRWLWEVPGA